MLRLIAQKFLSKFLFVFWLIVTSPPLLLLIWLIQSHERLRSVVSWLALPLVLAWVCGSWWLGFRTGYHMFDENRLFLTAVKHTWFDLKLRLSFVPVIGHSFTPDEDKTHFDDDDA